MDGSLIDSPPHIRGEPAGEYNLILDYMSKSVIGPLYMTCDRGSGIKVIEAGKNWNQWEKYISDFIDAAKSIYNSLKGIFK